MQIELYYIDSVRKEALYAKKIRKLFFTYCIYDLEIFFSCGFKGVINELVDKLGYNFYSYRQ